MPKKADGPAMTVEDAIAAARAKQNGEIAPPNSDTPEPEELSDDQLNAKFNELFASPDPTQEQLETSMDPDGKLTFNLGGMVDSPETIVDGPLTLSDDTNLPPGYEELVDSAFEPELPVDWDRLSEATKAEIAAGRAALQRYGSPAKVTP